MAPGTRNERSDGHASVEHTRATGKHNRKRTNPTFAGFACFFSLSPYSLSPRLSYIGAGALSGGLVRL